MPLPTNVATTLHDFGLMASAEERGIIYADGRSCEGARYHSPTPLVLHEVENGPQTVTLCGTCRDNLQVYSDLIEIDAGLPWTVRREFGNLIRAIATLRWSNPNG